MMRARPAVARFGRQMEAKLRENDDRTGWGVCSDYYLLDRLAREFNELARAVYQGDAPAKVIEEAADVANFAMMIADKRVPRSNGRGR